MSVVAVSMLGRFGNTLFQYAYAKAYALKHGAEFQCDPGWIGYRIFELEDPPIARELPQRTELTVQSGEVDICFRTYAQHQNAMLYTQQQIWDWFKFRPFEFAGELKPFAPPAVAHYRAGDFPGYNFPVISEDSYRKAALARGFESIRLISEENPIVVPDLHPDLCFLPDFMALTFAPVLFRANSSFSWWSAAIGKHEAVYSPIIKGLLGGKEHDNVEFVEGNWPALSNHDFVTDLHLPI